MHIEIRIDGELKTFTAPIVPVLAKRMYLKIEAENEKKGKDYRATAQQQLDEETEMASILSDVVFGGQFTVDQLFNGVSDKYFYEKLREAVFGIPNETNKEIDQEGNMKGE
ncbi:phage tail assembly chaperone G [Gracilibacillus alcaliphilus]|uniref:phage tail assembly chaperone G n=1 Tax=Gracilibacillus alcaliphilus TaxID=1401441 RepID=UPI00195AF647|nr:hypothetical protein [Gracilibacillus alcaliphilus]MBM7678377.1 hypothetical protein [Gracilibacillus alcaliphilus]